MAYGIGYISQENAKYKLQIISYERTKTLLLDASTYQIIVRSWPYLTIATEAWPKLLSCLPSTML